MAALGIPMEIRTFKPLHKPTQLQPHHIIGVTLDGTEGVYLGEGWFIG